MSISTMARQAVLLLILAGWFLDARAATGVWSAPGAGTNNTVLALAMGPGGEVYAGGTFSQAGTVTANCVAKWNGATWQSLGTGITAYAPVVYALATSGSDVYAGGSFNTAGGVAACNVARWDGTAWHPLGPVNTGVNGTVKTILVQDGRVYVGGSFTIAGGVAVRNVAVWDGASWHPLGTGCNGVVYSLAWYRGRLVAGGAFDSAGTVRATSLAQWDGSTWAPVGGGTGASSYVYSLAVRDTVLIAGGVFSTVGGVGASSVGQWNGSAWSALGSGVDLMVQAVAWGTDGLYAAGLFTMAGGMPMNDIAKWNGSSWEPLGGGVNSLANALAVAGREVYVGGSFTVAGAVSAGHVAHWSESTVITQAVLPGWNLVSVPVHADSTSPASLFPGSVAMYRFEVEQVAYRTADTLREGNGYWALFPFAQSCTAAGSYVDSVQVHVTRAGWFLLGSLSAPVPSSAVTSNPPGLVVGSPIRFNREQQRYETATVLTPGEGYWILAGGPCTIRLRR